MRLKPSESKRLREGLPPGATKELAAKRYKGKKISQRMVQYILKGEQDDLHGVIDEAIRMRDKNILRLMKRKHKI